MFNYKKLRFFMKKAQKNTVILEKETGISQSYISKIINGKKTPSLRTLDKLCKALGIKITDILD